MAFFRTRTDKHGNQYLYLEERWREGKKVRSRSTYIGRAGGEVDRSVAGHATEVEDIAQGAEQLAEREAGQPEPFSQESFLADTQAPAEAPAESDPAADAAPAGGDKDGGQGAEGEAQGSEANGGDASEGDGG